MDGRSRLTVWDVVTTQLTARGPGAHLAGGPQLDTPTLLCNLALCCELFQDKVTQMSFHVALCGHTIKKLRVFHGMVSGVSGDRDSPGPGQ